MDKNLAAVHAYLCADGYATTSTKWKYYRTGLRNTNFVLLKDFQEKFEKVFGVKPTIRKEGRCEKNSKEIYVQLNKKFGSFYSWEWRMPQLTIALSKIWLRAYFDCEGWVFCKSHQNRHIGADCVNEKGLNQVISALDKLGIRTTKKFNKKRKIYRIYIYNQEDLLKFKKEIGFLHPEKAKKLDEVSKDYVIYDWRFPENEEELNNFLKSLLIDKVRIKKDNGTIRIISKEESNLLRLQKELNRLLEIDSKVNRRINGIGTVYFELSINKQENIKKIIDNNLLNKEQKEKWKASKLKK